MRTTIALAAVLTLGSMPAWAGEGAWEETKEESHEAYEATEEGTEEAWEETKDESGDAYEATKEGAEEMDEEMEEAE